MATDFKKLEQKWQKAWESAKIFEVSEDSKKKKYYVLEMFPYPSGSGLHMGHAFNYTIGDIYARFKRMNGFNVLYPMGYDSLGLPAENAAIKENTHPKLYTEKSISNFIKQQKALGLSYDWSRVFKTHDPTYYKWDQWIFLKMFEKGIAFRKKAPVNWCPKCNSVLANEQVHDGKCWRHTDTSVEIKHLEQWFFRITDYADELYEKISSLKDWAEDVKAMQRNWIGKSYGTEIKFRINGEDWPIFTTRPDTIFGVTFMVISAQHPRLSELVTKEHRKEVDDFLKKIKSTSEKDTEELNKEGAFTGSYAINPMTDEKVPVYAGNFVVADYGAGMVMAVPTHDQRDFEFAKKYNIPLKVVINPDSYKLDAKKMTRAYTEDGVLINSEEFSGERNRDAIESITKHLEKKKLGKKVVQFKLRDWLISRQRYWGTPIPVIYCDKCGIVPVPEKELPVELPEDIKFGHGNPMETSNAFVNTTCPKCKGKARRETDTMDTFVNSSWYFLRYTDPKNSKQIFEKKKAKYWMPMDIYIGGKEHACMHLIYFRFYTKFLRDIGMIDIDEPTTRLFNQGMLHGDDGFVMSKSRGNVVLPETVSEKYGIDTARFFLVSIATPDKDREWSDSGIEGSMRFILKVLNYFDSLKLGKTSAKLESKLNKAIKEITSDIENLRYNLATIKLRQLFDSFEEGASKDALERFLKLMHPFCPHITEELWKKIGNKPFISTANWPSYDESKIDEKAEAIDAMIDATRADITKVLELTKIAAPKRIKIIISESWKYGFFSKFKAKLAETKDFKQIMAAMMSDAEMKKHGADIQKLIPALLKDPSKIPLAVLSQIDELKGLESGKAAFEKEFRSKIEIAVAEKCSEPKARQANPSKPAIVVE